MNGLTLGMRNAVASIVLLSLANPCYPSDLASSDHYAKAVVVWQADEPMCFEPDQPLPEQMASMPKPALAEEATPPRKIDGPPMNGDFFKGLDIQPILPVLEVVINPHGNVESIVALRPTTPEADQRIAEYLRQWSFEPSTNAGQPVCSTYVLVLHIYWQ